MKTIARLLVLLFILAFVGCATGSGGGAVAPSSSGSSGGKTLTDEDYKRIGIKGTV